jgi:hypothetical protein
MHLSKGRVNCREIKKTQHPNAYDVFKRQEEYEFVTRLRDLKVNAYWKKGRQGLILVNPSRNYVKRSTDTFQYGGPMTSFYDQLIKNER